VTSELHPQSLEACAGLWGGNNFIAALPAIRVVENALYIPWSGGGSWGVFNSQRNLVKESVNYHAGGEAISGPAPSYPSTEPEFESVRQDFIYLGFLNPHFGHFITNTLARFWPLLIDPKQANILCHCPVNNDYLCTLEFLKTMLRELDLTISNLVNFDRPTRIPKLIVPNTSLHEMFSVHSVFGDLCAYIGRGLWNPEEVDIVDQPIFFSKTRLSKGVGRFANEEDIVEVLDKAGVRIAFPEPLSFREQVRLLAMHKVLLGTTGPAFHTSVFSAPGRKIRALNQGPDVNSNFVLLDRINRNDSRYYFSRGMSHTYGDGFLTNHYVQDPRSVAGARKSCTRQTCLV
jgi:hypothetical protein